MTIRHLKMFAAVCEYGGVTRAAEALHVAQPVVSTAVSELEKYYGIRLFERINQRLVITEQGGELLVKARDVISCFEDFEGLAREDSGNPRVRVGSSLTIAQTGLPAIIKKIRERYPAVDLCIEANKTSEIEEGIMRGELDFGIVEDRVTSAVMKTVPLTSDRLVAVCSPDYPLPDAIGTVALAAQRLLLRETGSASRDFLDRIFTSHRVVAVPAMTSVGNSALIAACAVGFGVTVLPESLVSADIAACRLREIKITDADLSRDHFLILHKNKRLNAVQEDIFNICRGI